MSVSYCTSCICYIKSPFYGPSELAAIYDAYPCHGEHYDLPPGESDALVAKLKRIESYLPSRGRLLEIGSGRGHLLSLALARGWDAYGVELSGSARENLLPDVRDRMIFIRSEAGFPTLTAAHYDVVCSYQVFEHLLRPVESMRHWISSLVPGGLLHIDTPNAGSLGARIHQARWIAHAHREHYVLFSARALARLYRKHGIQILRQHFGGSPAICTRGETVGKKARKLLRFPSLSRLARTAIHRFGLGDNIEIIGRKP